HVLLADDHVIFRQGIRTLLERYGFEIVAEADDGREAIRLAQEVTPDVAILDLAMPQLSGSEAAQEIAQVSPKTRAILLTMYSEEPYVAKRSEEHTSELQSRGHLVCRLLLEKKKKNK